MHNAHSSAFDTPFGVLSVVAVQLRGEEHLMNIYCSVLVVLLLLLHGRGSRPAEVSCLNNMSLSELLRLKHSVELLSCSSEDRPPTAAEADNSTGAAATTGVSLSAGSPSALPLTHARSYPEPWNEKPTKLHTLFQVSVTALAFLSFGGYLLCLIVQAIKSKGTTYFHPVATATSTTNSGQVKKIKIFRRSRRMVNNTLRAEEASYVDSMAGPDPEELYKSLLYFAEGYVVGLK